MRKQKTNKKTRGFIFQCIWWWPVINLFTLIHGYSHLISREFVVSFTELRSFPGIQVNLYGLLEKLDVMYPSRNLQYGISRVKFWD